MRVITVYKVPEKLMKLMDHEDWKDFQVVLTQLHLLLHVRTFCSLSSWVVVSYSYSVGAWW